eukprot:1707565-Alexandrium_andersonii.AAC.1
MKRSTGQGEDKAGQGRTGEDMAWAVIICAHAVYGPFRDCVCACRSSACAHVCDVWCVRARACVRACVR